MVTSALPMVTGALTAVCGQKEMNKKKQRQMNVL